MKILRFWVVLLLGFGLLFGTTSWTKHGNNPVMEADTAGSWDAHIIQCEVLNHDDTLRMWYVGNDGGEWKTKIGYAWSLDGISWNKHPEPVMSYADLFWIDDLIWFPSVIFNDTLNCYCMWYTADYRRSGYAESSDGINWTHNATPCNAPFDSNTDWGGERFMITEVIMDGDVYKAWYDTWEEGQSIWYSQSGYAESTDGINWTRHTEPVILRGEIGSWDDNLLCTYSVLEIDNTYFAWYCACDYSDERYQIGHATSVDGIIWTKIDSPVVKRGDPGTYDADLLLSPSVIKSPDFDQDQTLWMWYRSKDVDVTDASLENDDICFASALYVDIIDIIPNTYKLLQNYPNPFNPVTTISYQLTTNNEVDLTIYDLTGRKIKTLINEYQPAGYHAVNWNASEYSSGIYFYRLTAGDFIETKKMVLMK